MTENEAYELYVFMEPSAYNYREDWSFYELHLKIEFRNSIVEDHPIIKRLEEELDCRYLIFTEIENELLRITELPYLDDWYDFEDCDTPTPKRFGPFSSEEMLIDFVKKFKTIPFKDDRIFKSEADYDVLDDVSWEVGDY